MRSSRLVALSLAAAATVGFLPSSAAAQAATSGFADSWYWGGYGGFMNFSTAFGTENINTTAPSIGADWMLTRTKFALHIFAEQSYFSTQSSISSPSGGAPLAVNVNDMRRVGFDMMLFPIPDFHSIKPYAGIGYAFNFINSAALRTCSGCNTFATQDDAAAANKAILDARSQGKMFFNIGAMYMYKKFAPFVQGTLMPSQGSSSWYVNGTGFTTMWAIGLRYNFGSSIEKW